MALKILQFAFAIVFIAASAQLTLHLPEKAGGIPISGQSLAVLLVGYLLPRPWGMMAVLAYVLLGGFGLPVFADGKAGWSVISGASGGFLLGFIVAADFAGAMARGEEHPAFGHSLLAMLLGTLIILAFGLGRLALLYGPERALAYGLYPFWEGALIKVFLGAIIAQLYLYSRQYFRKHRP